MKRMEQTPIMHRIVSHAGVVYLGGVVADDLEAGMAGQVRQVCAKIDKLLGAAGSDKSKLLSVQIFITDMSLKEDMNRAWCDWLTPSEFPARATIGAADLGSPRILVEMVATAAV